MFNKVIDRTIVVVRYQGIDFKYKNPLTCEQAMRLAYRTCLASEINQEYWTPVDPTKIVMMKMNAEKDLEVYNPTHKSFDTDVIKKFMNRSIIKFHARRAYWRKHPKEDKLVIISGTFVNKHLSGFDDVTMQNLWNAMESYNRKILDDIHIGKYGIGVEMMSFSEVMAA